MQGGYNTYFPSESSTISVNGIISKELSYFVNTNFTPVVGQDTGYTAGDKIKRIIPSDESGDKFFNETTGDWLSPTQIQNMDIVSDLHIAKSIDQIIQPEFVEVPGAGVGVPPTYDFSIPAGYGAVNLMNRSGQDIQLKIGDGDFITWANGLVGDIVRPSSENGTSQIITLRAPGLSAAGTLSNVLLRCSRMG